MFCTESSVLIDFLERYQRDSDVIDTVRKFEPRDDLDDPDWIEMDWVCTRWTSAIAETHLCCPAIIDSFRTDSRSGWTPNAPTAYISLIFSLLIPEFP
jgi:hypothetical protein